MRRRCAADPSCVSAWSELFVQIHAAELWVKKLELFSLWIRDWKFLIRGWMAWLYLLSSRLNLYSIFFLSSLTCICLFNSKYVLYFTEGQASCLLPSRSLELLFPSLSKGKKNQIYKFGFLCFSTASLSLLYFSCFLYSQINIYSSSSF